MITLRKLSLLICLPIYLYIHTWLLISDYIMNQTKTTIYPILSSYVIRQELRWTGVREMPTGRCRNQNLLPECLSSRGLRGFGPLVGFSHGFHMVHIVPFKAAFETVVFHLVLLLNFMGCRELDPYFFIALNAPFLLRCEGKFVCW